MKGKVLRHCIDYYIGWIASGEKIIVLIQKKEKPQEPLYVMEFYLEKYRLIKVREFDNEDMREELNDLINMYQLYI